MTEPTGPNPFADEPVRSSAPAGPNPFADDPRAAPTAPPERTWWDTAKDVGQTADDVVRAAANAMTFGMADRLAGYAGGKGTDAEVKLSEAARKRSPIASIAGDVGGAVALPGIGGRQLAARMGGGWGARALGYGGEGAILGAASGAGNTYTGKPMDYLANAGWGAAIGASLGAGMGAIFGPAGGMQSKAKPTTLDEIGPAKRIAYDTLERNKAGYDRDFLAGKANELDAGPLYNFYNKADIPTTQAALDRMRNLPRQFASPAEVESIRKGINTIPDLRPTDIAAGRHVTEALDKFYASPPKGAVRPGTEAEAALAAHQAKTARDLAAAEFRMKDLANMRVAAENQAASSYSGLNVENNIRNQIKNFVNPRTGGGGRLAGYTPEEQAALNHIIRGGTVANVGRWAGNIAAGGGGLAVPVAAMAGNEFVKDNPTLSVGVPAAGLALRMLSNRGARNNIRAAEDLIGSRDPLFAQRAANTGMKPPGSAATQQARNIMTQALIQQGYGQTGFEDEPRLRLTVHPDYGTR
jgi:hypothetical protein